MYSVNMVVTAEGNELYIEHVNYDVVNHAPAHRLLVERWYHECWGYTGTFMKLYSEQVNSSVFHHAPAHDCTDSCNQHRTESKML
jgi:hypothetical protein